MPIDTKKFIADSFYEMSKTTSLDKITVKDLVEKCNISRQTFYYHFKDIIDVMEYNASQGIARMNSIVLKEEASTEKAVEAFVFRIAQLHDIIQRLLASKRREEIEKAFLNCISAYFQKYLPGKSSDTSAGPFEKEAAAHFCACGIAGLLLKYGGSHDSQELSKIIYQFINNFKV